MSYVAELDQTARALARLAVAGTAGLDPSEIDIALSARRALINVLSTVLDDITGLPTRIKPLITFESIARHPVAELPAALSRYPTPPPTIGPIVAITLEPVTAAGRAWRDVARHATLAHHEWATGEPTQIDDTAAWTAVADVATLASLLSDIDAELVRALKTLDVRQSDTTALEGCLASGLGLIARETLRLAVAGPLNETSPDRTRSEPPPGVLRVTDPVDLVPAMRQIGILLRDADHVQPEHARLIAIAHAKACRTLADILERGPDHTDAAARLREHAARLTHAVERPWSMSSLTRGDRRGWHQADDVQRAVRRWSPDEVVAFVDAAQLLSAVAETTRELAATTDRQLHRGEWLVPITRTAAPHARVSELWVGYERYKTGSSVPRQLTRLAAAADHALVLMAAGLPERSAPAVEQAPVVDINPARTAAPTAEPAAPRPPPRPLPATHQAAPASWRELARRRATVRPRTPWLPPNGPHTRRRR
jgi:hypothetical protein